MDDSAPVDVVRRATDGDPAAFETLVRNHRSSVRVVARSFTADQDEVEDMVQETFLRALVALPNLQDPTRFRPWLFAIARNLGRDHQRRRTRRPVVADDEDGVDPTDDAPLPEETVEVRELAASVHIAIGRLSPQDATLLAMVTNLGFTPLDVAASLGMSHTAAKVALHRARQRLRRAMAVQDAAPVRGRGCDEFRTLYDAEDLVAAALHARACADCQKRPAPVRAGN